MRRRNTNTVESSFALVKRGIVRIYRNVSKKHSHRYFCSLIFVWNNLRPNDGERISAVIRASEENDFATKALAFVRFQGKMNKPKPLPKPPKPDLLKFHGDSKTP